MNTLKGLQRIGLLSLTCAVLAFGGNSANAAAPAVPNVATPAGACTGVAGTSDCATAVGHISASVIGTLSINEVRAISFGNYGFTAISTGAATVLMNPVTATNVLTVGGDTILQLHGAQATPAGTGTPWSPGLYHVSGGQEDATGTEGVYISFADNAGVPINACDPDGTNCDTTFAANQVTMDATTPGANQFKVDKFSFNQVGKDVYGRYTNTDATGAVDVKVGATMHTVAATYTPGKYVGLFNIMVSY